MRDNSPQHEYPAQLLAALAERIALVRGKPIRCFGAMSLFLLGEDGGVERTMQADQTVYLHPQRANPVGWSRMVVGECSDQVELMRQWQPEVPRQGAFPRRRTGSYFKRAQRRRGASGCHPKGASTGVRPLCCGLSEYGPTHLRDARLALGRL